MNGSNLYLTGMMNEITISSAVVKRKLMTVTKESETATKVAREVEEGWNLNKSLKENI